MQGTQRHQINQYLSVVTGYGTGNIGRKCNGLPTTTVLHHASIWARGTICLLAAQLSSVDMSSSSARSRSTPWPRNPTPLWARSWHTNKTTRYVVSSNNAQVFRTELFLVFGCFHLFCCSFSKELLRVTVSREIWNTKSWNLKFQLICLSVAYSSRSGLFVFLCGHCFASLWRGLEPNRVFFLHPSAGFRTSASSLRSLQCFFSFRVSFVQGVKQYLVCR